MHQILLIDDDEKLADLLSRYFVQHNLSLTSALAPSQGFSLLEKQAYDLIILDIMLPEMDGFDVCRQLRQQYQTPVLMLTARGDVMDRIVGLELGADDYMPKPFEPRELVARIHNIIRRSQVVHSVAESSAGQHFGGVSLKAEQLDAVIDDRLLGLSTLEYRLLELLINHVNETLTRDQILNALRGHDVDIYSRSVDILVSRLRQKLQPLTPIVTVRGQGYRFVHESVSI